MYRAFYRPPNGKYDETFVDANTLEELPSGAIFVIKMNEDGTREIIEDAGDKRSLTAKEKQYHKFAQRHLEFKHDGGDTGEMKKLLMEKMGRL